MTRIELARGVSEVVKDNLILGMEFIVRAEIFIALSHSARSMEKQKDLSMVGP